MTIDEAKELATQYRPWRREAFELSKRCYDRHTEADRLRAQLEDAGFGYLLAPPKEKT